MRSAILFVASGAAVLGTLAGCAKTIPVEGATPASSAVVGARWSANIQSVTQSRGEVVQTTRDRSYGNASWTVGASPSLSVVSLIFTYTGQERSLPWAILPGSCGSPSLPVIPLSNFPELNVGGGGRAQVTASLPLELPSTGTYHIDVYRDRRSSTEFLVACGNLKYSGG